MSEQKHTPGPWRVGYGGGTGMGHIFADGFGEGQPDSLGETDSLAAAHFPPLYDHGSFSREAIEIMEANARLIGAAPELLAALRSVQEWADEQGATIPVRCGVRDLIARAEGDS